ncbi:MAG: cardiolipin synthase [Treponema sp.]|nr:cardiolipin synthase [Treponema sp.]
MVSASKPCREPKRPARIRKLLTHPVIKSIIYGRVVLSFIFAAAQLAVFFIFIARVQKYVEFFLGLNSILSFIFIIYLVNKSGKNEYKIAWLVPSLIFPLFGIGLYLWFHADVRRKHIQRSLKKLRTVIEPHLIAAQPPETAVVSEFDTTGITHYLARNAGFVPYAASAVQYYPSGEASLSDIMQAINSAEHFIFIEFFIINPGVMWDALLTALIKKRASGVEIRVIYDSFGSIALSPRRYERYLESLGIKTLAFVPVVPFIVPHQFSRDHRKIIVVDNKIGFTGGINISDEYINKKPRFGYWKDTMVQLSGPAVNSLTGLFLSNWNLFEKSIEDVSPYFLPVAPVPDADGIVIPFGDDPYDDLENGENVYCSMIDNARHSVHITTPYIVVDNQMLHSIIYAVQRGIDVTLIIPSQADHYITFCVGRVVIKTLINNGVHIYSFAPGFIHAKMVIADGQYAVVGSINFDYRSFNNQFESAVLMYNKKIITDIERDFAAIKAQSEEITQAAYKKIPAVQRMIGWCFRLFAPLI